MLPLLTLPASPADYWLAHSLQRQLAIEATSKRKVDGSLAATRLGSSTTERWANERFRQTMLLVLEFRREWPGQSLLAVDDVSAIRTAALRPSPPLAAAGPDTRHAAGAGLRVLNVAEGLR